MLKKKTAKLISTVLMIVSMSNQVAFAHSGRTDSSGGHKDNKNASGLGSYHYHCGGYPAHLHTNGTCPYKGNSTSSNSSTKTNNNNSAAKSEARQSGYNSGYEAAINGQAYSDSNSSSYESEYKDGYSSGYEKGKSELETKVQDAYNEGFAIGASGEVENNLHTVQVVKDSYLNGYKEGIKVYVEQNTDTYTQFAEEDAVNFKMRTFEGNVPSELIEKYTTTYNNKTNELKKIAYNEAYMQAIGSKNSDSSKFTNDEEIKSYNEGYSLGVNALEEEKKTAYEFGYNGEEYFVPVKFAESEEVLVASYDKGLDELKAKQKKTVTTTVGAVTLALAGISGRVLKKKKSSKKY